MSKYARNKIIRCIPAPDADNQPPLTYKPRAIFADETIQGLRELGGILQKVYTRLIFEGWKSNLKTAEFISPTGDIYTTPDHKRDHSSNL